MRLGGLTEVARELGVSRQRVTQLRNRTEFPSPIGEISAGAIWDLDEVKKWSDSGLRLGAGRPKAGARPVLGGRYRLEVPPIGSGGFADVYRATDLRQTGAMNHVVAVKVLRSVESLEDRKRFLRELEIIAQLEHENVVPVLAYGETDAGQPWYAMPLAKGSLAEEVADMFGDEVRTLEVMRQVSEGLKYLHNQGVCHRDLKPANVLWIRSDSWAISDLGLAKQEGRETTILTTTEQGLGSYFYAAPEVWTSAKKARETADIFSLGKVLQELVTGKLPLVGDVPRGVYRPVIQRATKHSAEERYQTVEEFMIALESASHAPRGRWESVPEAVQRLTDRVRGDQPDEASLTQLLTLALSDDAEPRMRELAEIVSLLSRVAITRLWQKDSEGFRELVQLYAKHVAEGSWPFDFCDVIADFLERAVLITDDEEIRSAALHALVELGSSHRRWHVQDVVMRLLQSVRETEDALSAVEGLRKAGKADLRWTIGDFAVRSLHPVLREFLDGSFSQYKREVG